MTISKSELRALVKKREASLSDFEIEASDRELAASLIVSPEFAAAKTVMLYWGVGREPDTRPMIDAALKAGKLVALPCVTGPGAMEARRIFSLTQLVPGAFGIPEPDRECEVVDPGEFDLILVPGAAFSPDGRRLGRGGGYYDRYLPQTRGVKVALARKCQLTDDIPTDIHDINVDLIITK